MSKMNYDMRVFSLEEHDTEQINTQETKSAVTDKNDEYIFTVD